MAESIMPGAQNSPMHRRRELLCDGNLNRMTERVNGLLDPFPVSQPRETAYTGELTHSDPLITAVMEPMLASYWNPPAFHPMNQTAAGYYPDQPPQLPICNSQSSQQLGYYPMTFNEFLPATCSSIMTTPERPVAASTSGGMHCEPTFVTRQPPIPPTIPESYIPPNPPFNFHPCRWLSGPRCDGHAPGKNREMGEHLRTFHKFIGHERDTVQCEWENCGQVMQRMNIPRHIVSRHLLAAASCRFCSKQFSRPDVVSRHERTCSGVYSV